MNFVETPLAGAFVIEPAPLEDSRGFFARCYCEAEFQLHDLHTVWPQCNISFNHRRGTLRGMHWQAAPHEEVKLVRCTAGAIYDVIIDLRPEADTYGKSFSVQLTADNRRMLYIPRGFAHGFLTLADSTEVFYQMGASYAAEFSRGLRWNDPALAITWPEEVRIVSDRDRSYPDFPL